MRVFDHPDVLKTIAEFKAKKSNYPTSHTKIEEQVDAETGEITFSDSKRKLDFGGLSFDD